MSNIKEKLERLLAYEAKTQNEISAELKDRVTAKRVANLKTANDEYDKAAAKSGKVFGEPETDKALDKSYAAWKKLERNRLLNLKDWRQKLNGDEFVTLKDGREGTLGGLVYDKDNNFIGYEFSTNPYGGYEYEKIQPEDIASVNESAEDDFAKLGKKHRAEVGKLKASLLAKYPELAKGVNNVPKEELDTYLAKEKALMDKRNKAWTKINNAACKAKYAKNESLQGEYKQAFDLLIEGENIVGTLDTDFGKQFVKDVESLYEIKSYKLKLRKAKELLRDLQGYLVDEQYDGYNAKIDKFMNNSKNEISDETVYRAAAKSHDRVMKSMANDSEFDKNLDKYNSLMNMGLRREWKKAGLKDPGEMSAKQLGKVWDKDYTPVVDKFHKNVRDNLKLDAFGNQKNEGAGSAVFFEFEKADFDLAYIEDNQVTINVLDLSLTSAYDRQEASNGGFINFDLDKVKEAAVKTYNEYDRLIDEPELSVADVTVSDVSVETIPNLSYSWGWSRVELPKDTVLTWGKNQANHYQPELEVILKSADGEEYRANTVNVDGEYHVSEDVVYAYQDLDNDEDEYEESLNEKTVTPKDIKNFLKEHGAKEVNFGSFGEIKRSGKVDELVAYGSKKVAGTYDETILYIYKEGARLVEKPAKAYGKFTEKFFKFSKPIEEKINEEYKYGEYQDDPNFEQIANQLESGNTYGMFYGGAEWGEVEINGVPISDLLKTDEITDWVLHELSYPVRYGHDSYYGLNLIFNNYSYEDQIDHTDEDIIADLVALGFDEEEVKEMAVIKDPTYDGDISDERFKEIETWVDFDILYKPVEDDEDDEYDESLSEAKVKPETYKGYTIYNTDQDTVFVNKVNGGYNVWTLGGVIKNPKEIIDNLKDYENEGGSTFVKTREELKKELADLGISESLSEAKVKPETLKAELEEEIKKFFKYEPDALDWAFVEITKEEGRTRVEVRAELSYKGMWNLSELLNPIVSKYDKYAYFDFEQPGIMVAFIENKKGLGEKKTCVDRAKLEALKNRKSAKINEELTISDMKDTLVSNGFKITDSAQNYVAAKKGAISLWSYTDKKKLSVSLKQKNLTELPKGFRKNKQYNQADTKLPSNKEDFDALLKTVSEAKINESVSNWKQYKGGLVQADKYIQLVTPIDIEGADLDLVALIFKNREGAKSKFGYELSVDSGADTTLLSEGSSDYLPEIIDLCLAAIKEFDEKNNTNIIYDVKPLEPSQDDINFLKSENESIEAKINEASEDTVEKTRDEAGNKIVIIPFSIANPDQYSPADRIYHKLTITQESDGTYSYIETENLESGEGFASAEEAVEDAISGQGGLEDLDDFRLDAKVDTADIAAYFDKGEEIAESDKELLYGYPEGSGTIEIGMTRDMVVSICTSGSNDAAVEQVKQDPVIRKQLDEIPEENFDVLKRVLDMDQAEFDSLTINELEDYALWLAAWDIYEDEEYSSLFEVKNLQENEADFDELEKIAKSKTILYYKNARQKEDPEEITAGKFMSIVRNLIETDTPINVNNTIAPGKSLITWLNNGVMAGVILKGKEDKSEAKEVKKSKYTSSWQLDGEEAYAKIAALKDKGYQAKIWDKATAKTIATKTFASKEEAIKWAKGQLKSDLKETNLSDMGQPPLTVMGVNKIKKQDKTGKKEKALDEKTVKFQRLDVNAEPYEVVREYSSEQEVIDDANDFYQDTFGTDWGGWDTDNEYDPNFEVKTLEQAKELFAGSDFEIKAMEENKVNENLDKLSKILKDRATEKGWLNLSKEQINAEIKNLQKKGRYDNYTLDMTLLHHLKDVGNTFGEAKVNEISDKTKGRALSKRTAQARQANKKFMQKYPDAPVTISKDDPRAQDWLKDSEDSMNKTMKARKMYGKVVKEKNEQYVVRQMVGNYSTVAGTFDLLGEAQDFLMDEWIKYATENNISVDDETEQQNFFSYYSIEDTKAQESLIKTDYSVPGLTEDYQGTIEVFEKDGKFYGKSSEGTLTEGYANAQAAFDSITDTLHEIHEGNIEWDADLNQARQSLNS